MPQLRFVVVFLACAAAVWRDADANSTGAPQCACSTLIPQHEGTNSVTGGKPPYFLKAPQSVAAGSTTVVRIDGAPFKGFIIRVMDASGSSNGARFEQGGPGSRFQAIRCDAPDDTATHTDPTEKTSIEVPWTAPTVPGTYRIVATVVKDYSLYYSGYYTDVVVV